MSTTTLQHQVTSGIPVVRGYKRAQRAVGPVCSATLNDSSATRYGRRKEMNASGKSAPDVTIARVEESERLYWGGGVLLV